MFLTTCLIKKGEEKGKIYKVRIEKNVLKLFGLNVCVKSNDKQGI